MFLSQEDFATVVRSTPLISIDLIVENERGESCWGNEPIVLLKASGSCPAGACRRTTLANAFERLTLVELACNCRWQQASFTGLAALL